MNIIPMWDLKDTVKIEKLCKESQAPVFVTKNGYGSLVVMDIDYFEKLLREVYETQAIKEGLEDLEARRVSDGEKVLKGIKKKCGL